MKAQALLGWSPAKRLYEFVEADRTVFLPQLGPRDPSHTRPYHNSVPFSQISDEYTDRPAAMQQLEAALLERSSRWQHIRGAVVVGMAGTRKTQLILKYALVHAHEYDTILWVNADKPSSVVGSFELIARDLQLVDYNISLLSTAQVMPQQSTAVRNILEWLTKRTTPWLLILDNADEDDWGLRDILPRAGHGTVIITTQDRAIPRALKINSVCLDVMLEEEAVALLLEAVGCTQWTENLALLELCTDVVRRLEYLPLAIHLAGATINCDAALLAAGPERVGICTRSAINGYLTAFQNNRSALLRDTNHDFLRSPHRTTVWTAWETTFQLLERARTKSGTGVSPNVLLTFLAFLDPAVILYTHLKDAHAGLLRGQDFPYYKVSDWPPWLLRLVSAEYSLSQTIGNKSCEWSHDCYSQTMSRLWRYGLIRSKNADWSEEISLHKLVRWRAQQEADEKEYLQAYAQLLELITWASSRNTSAYRIYYETDDYDLDDPSTRGRLIRTLDELCSTYERLRHWEAAHNKLGWLLHEQVESLGRSNPGTISTLCRKLEAGVHTVSGNEVEEISEFIHGGSQTEQMALVENLPLQLRTLWSSVLQRDKKSSHAGWSNGDSDDDGGVPLRLEGLVGVSGASSVHIMDSRSWLRRSMEAFVSRAYRRWEKHERRSQIRTQMRSIQRTVRRDETRLHDRGQKASQDTEAAAPDLPTLFEVFSHGSWSTVSNYLRFIDAETVRYRDPIQRRTILHWAAARGFDTAAVRCLAFGSDINAPRTTSAADLCIMLARISIWVWWKRLSNMEQTSLLRMPVA